MNGICVVIGNYGNIMVNNTDVKGNSEKEVVYGVANYGGENCTVENINVDIYSEKQQAIGIASLSGIMNVRDSIIKTDSIERTCIRNSSTEGSCIIRNY